MAYQAQIKIKTTGLQQLNKVNAAVDKINKSIIQINKGSARVKTNNIVKISKQDLLIKKDILKVETEITKQKAEQAKLGARQAKTGGSSGGGVGGKAGGKGIASSALISGAFPLLFGQGLPGAVVGGLGGGIGAAVGGQMGGFAGGLIATGVLQQITQTVNAVGELGQALNPLTADLNKLTTAVGLAGTQEGLRLRILEQTEGKQAALAAATQNMALVVGDAGVESLRTFGENFSAISNNFARFNTRMQAGFAELFNRVLELFPGLKGEGGASPAVNETVEGRLKNEPEAKELNTRISELKDEIVRLETAISNRTNPFIPKELTNFFKGGSTLFPSQMGTIDEGIAEKTDETKLNQTKDELKIEVDKLNVLKEQFTTEEKIKERKKTANSAQKAALSTTQKEIELLKAKLDGNFEEVQLNQEVDAIVQELLNKGILIEDINKKDIENQLNREKSLKKQVTQAKKLEDAFAQLSVTIGNDIKNGIAGLIKGTSTLGDLLNNVADRFLDVALNQALFGSILGSGGEKGGGLLGAIGLFANGGRPPVGKPSIVGEKGPELFVPRSSGTIVPNNKLGGGGSTSVVVNVDASGSDVQGDDAGAKELGTLISVAVQGELLKQQRPGGLLSSLR